MKNVIIALLALGYIALHVGYTRKLARVNTQFNAYETITKDILKKYEQCRNRSR